MLRQLALLFVFALGAVAQSAGMAINPDQIPAACQDKCVKDVIAGSTCTAEDGDCVTDDICDEMERFRGCFECAGMLPEYEKLVTLCADLGSLDLGMGSSDVSDTDTAASTGTPSAVEDEQSTTGPASAASATESPKATFSAGEDGDEASVSSSEDGNKTSASASEDGKTASVAVSATSAAASPSAPAVSAGASNSGAGTIKVSVGAVAVGAVVAAAVVL